MSTLLRLSATLVLLLASTSLAAAQDVSDYRTVEQAITTKIAKSDSNASHVPAYLGVEVTIDDQKRVMIQEVAAESPAARAGLKRGDQLLQVGGKPVADDNGLRDLLKEQTAGDKVLLRIKRYDKSMDLKATLTALTHPLSLPRQGYLGIDVGKTKDAGGVAIEKVASGSPAQKADLKVGDILLKLNGTNLTAPEKFTELLQTHKPGDSITLTLAAADKSVDKKIVLGGELPVEEKKGGGSWDTRFNALWKKPVYHLAVICIEYPDEKHNATITSQAWEDSLFSKGTYTKTSVTGQQVFGSVYDFYLEQSYGKIKIEGKVFDFVEVSKKRNEYATAAKQALLTEATDKLLARDGKEALSAFDGVFFLYAGTLPKGTQRGGGSLYWPHRGSFAHGGKRWPYFICPEGGEKMANISVFAHEFGHMLGLPDLYARAEWPGFDGLGQWCLMANQVGNGRPQHASAWCKEKLGWVEPAVIDPTVKQKLILAPIEDSSKECLKILIHRDASEYLLLENRIHKGFDKSLPGEGLLIWRVVKGQPALVESHGVEGPTAPRVYLNSVPFPSAANDAFTPFTTPSSRSKLGGGLPVYITNIRRLQDGRITLHVGYEYQ
jgi:M6 family metalloprotease-like protein